MKVNIDWAGKHGTFAGTINATWSVWALTVLARSAHISGLWVLALFVLAGVAAMLTAARPDTAAERAHPGIGTLLYRLVSWAAGGGWSAWQITWGNPWRLHAVLTLVAGALVIGAFATWLSVRAQLRARRQQEEHDKRMRDAIAWGKRKVLLDWQDRVRRVTRVDVTMTGIEFWDNGSGFTLDGDLPLGGTTAKDLKPFEERLAADARLGHGCGVEILPGVNKGAALFQVSTRFALADDQPYPEEYEPLTVLNPLSVGSLRDYAPAEVELREKALAVIGQRGSGKTNFLHVNIANLARCVDTLVWVIDLGGGGLVLPWLYPYLEGVAERPAIDWVATTPEEALAMTRDALAIARARKPAYRDLRRQHNTDLLPISPDVPQVQIIIDEGAEVLGDGVRGIVGQIRDNLETVQRIAREVAVNVEASGLRATSDVISPAMRKGTQNRVGLRVTDQEELAYLFGWHRNLDPQDVPFPGCGFIATDAGAPRPFRVYRLLPAQIEEIAEVTSQWRPALDEPSVAVTEHYAGRWDRFRRWLDGEQEPVTTQAPASSSATATAASSTGTVAVQDLSAARGRIEDIHRRLVRERAESEQRDPDLAEDFWELTRNLDLSVPDSPEPEVEQPYTGNGHETPRDALVRIIRDAGTDGIILADVLRALRAEGVTAHRSTVHDWLNDALAQGVVVRRGKGIYIHRDHAGG